VHATPAVFYCFGNVKLLPYAYRVNEPQKWAGERLGLPETGIGSLAKMGRRVLALFIDWGFASLVSIAFFKNENLATLLAFAVEQWLLVATTGTSIGHRLLGIAVRRLDGSLVGYWRSLIRVGLILLVLPATIWDADNRGLHDKAAQTVLVLSR
jgi:uncharacterized RDD family membrane protein YckC